MIQRAVVVLIFLLPFAVQAQECPALKCDCDSIPSSEWRSQCEQYSSSNRCDAAKSSNYCPVAGFAARALPLSVVKAEGEDIADLDKAIEKLKLLSWAIREDNSAAVTLQSRGELKAALAKRKGENSKRRQLHKASLDVARYYFQQGRDAEAKDLFAGLVARNQKDAELSLQAGLALWQTREDYSSPKVAEVLAQRIMRNASLEAEMAADFSRRSQEYSDASRYWAQSAEITDQLLSWKQEQGAKAKVIAFYQQSSAARWYQSALTALMDDDEDKALEAKLKSEERWAAYRH